MDAIEVIKTRRSVRAFAGRAVPRDVLTDLVDCARQAPTAMNRQQWEFVVVTQAAGLAELARIIFHAPWLASAGAAVVVLCDPANEYWVEDGSAATQNLMLAARAHGLGSCWLAAEKQGYADAIRQAVGAPEKFKVLSVVALGYGAESPAPEKRPVEQLLHWEKF